MSIHVDPKKLIVAQKLRRDGKTTQAIADRLGISEPTASRWSRGLTQNERVEPTVDIPITAQPYWGDASDWGWKRYAPKDSYESFHDDDGAFLRESRVIDPSIVYPEDWKARRISKIPKIEQRGGGVQRFLLTGAQDKTPVHGPFATNLVRYAQHIGAEIIVGSATYARDWYGAIFGGTARSRRGEKNSLQVLDWSSALDDVITSKRRLLSPKISYCAEVNILPTARNPLSDLETYNRGNSAVFSHPRQDLKSVPRSPDMDPVLVMGSGYITTPNYIDKKTGHIARFHHIIGAILIEIDADGYVYPTRIHADAKDGSFYCYDILVRDNKIFTGQRVAGLVYADAHIEQMDDEVAKATWGIGLRNKSKSLQYWLNPRTEVFHDTLDFWSKNYHNSSDPWHNFEVKVRGVSIADEIKRVVDFLGKVRRPDTKILIAESNHDLALSKWLKEADWRTDPTNAQLHLQANLFALAHIKKYPDDIPPVYEYCARALFANKLENVTFLRSNSTFLIVDVDVSKHGHNGPNGARGSHRNGIRTARKQMSGHEHGPAEREGYDTVGTSHRLIPMPKYARGGASDWAAAHGMIYANGRTALTFIHAGRPRALGKKRAA